jgi:hypothetical protein
VRRESKIGILRFIAALIAGLVLCFGFVFGFASIAPQYFESMAEFVNSMLGLGFEGAFATIVIIVTGIALLFSVLCWLVMRSWGPLRRDRDAAGDHAAV